MLGRHALVISLAAVASLTGAPSAAPAQCRLCDATTTERPEQALEDAIRLEVATTLDFDRLVLLGAGEGQASILPNGERLAAGSVATISGRAMVGSVTIRGAPGRAIRVDLPPRIDLHSLSGGRISVEELATDLTRFPRLNSAGQLTFRFGGKLRISGDVEGDFRGEIPITVDYL